MERSQSSGPDEAPEVTDQLDVEAASPAAPADALSEETGTSGAETDPLGGTGGASSGGAG